MDKDKMDMLRNAGFGKEVERVARGLCASCGEKPGPFKDELSRREFGISGLCQKCQDDVFGGPEDEDAEEGGEDDAEEE